MDAVAHYYGRRGKSGPITYGITISRALRPLTEGRDTADVCIEAAKVSVAVPKAAELFYG